jgi:hypothetical protein
VLDVPGALRFSAVRPVLTADGVLVTTRPLSADAVRGLVQRTGRACPRWPRGGRRSTSRTWLTSSTPDGCASRSTGSWRWTGSLTPTRTRLGGAARQVVVGVAEARAVAG